MRLDEELVRRGLSPSRSRARDSIKRGTVMVDGSIESKPSRTVRPESEIALSDPASAYVSRAALKLIAALDEFGFDPTGRTALDVGASTGGFTQVLLERGARRVYAVDVGTDQLADPVRADERVTVMEGVNARDLTAASFDETPNLITLDLSFISQILVLPQVLGLAAAQTQVVSLFKPQFEVGRAALGKGGIVRDDAAVSDALERVKAEFGAKAFTICGVIESPIEGGDGNREFLIGASRD